MMFPAVVTVRRERHAFEGRTVAVIGDLRRRGVYYLLVILPDGSLAEHHTGYIDWATYEANQRRLAQNTRPEPHKSCGAVREGGTLLQGLTSSGHCGRRLHTHYRGRNSTQGYHCAGKTPVEGRGV
jgi:hypothetical protein